MTRLIATPEHIKAIIRDYAPWQAEKPQFRPDLACQAFDSEADGTTIKLHAADSEAPADDHWFVIVCPGYGADRYLVNLTKEQYDEIRNLMLQNITGGGKLAPVVSGDWKKQFSWRKTMGKHACPTKK